MAVISISCVRFPFVGYTTEARAFFVVDSEEHSARIKDISDKMCKLEAEAFDILFSHGDTVAEVTAQGLFSKDEVRQAEARRIIQIGSGK